MPDRDIEIRFVGLRPGEKLEEELIARGERALPTSHPKIHELRGSALFPCEITVWIDELQSAIEQRDEAGAIAHLAALAPEYEPAKAGAKLHRPRPAAVPAAVG